MKFHHCVLVITSLAISLLMLSESSGSLKPVLSEQPAVVIPWGGGS